MCFSIANSFAQFIPLGPVGSSTFNSLIKSGNATGLGQIHCFGIPPDYTDASKPNSFNTLYAGSPFGGLWKSTDAGASWEVVEAVQHLPINSVSDSTIVPEPAAPVGYLIYICQKYENTRTSALEVIKVSQAGAYVSADGGASFQHLDGLSNAMSGFRRGFGQVNQIAYNPNNTNILYAATSVGLFKSTDKGLSWSKIFDDSSSPIGFYAVSVSKINNSIIYLSGTNIFRSFDAGFSFSNINVPTSVSDNLNVTNNNAQVCNNILENKKINIRLFQNGNDERLFANIYSTYTNCFTDGKPSSTNAIFQLTASNTTTGSWSRITNSGMFFTGQYGNFAVPGRTDFAVHPTDPDIIIGGNTQAMRTDDGGVTWDTATGYWDKGHADIHAVEFLPGNNEVLIGCDGGIFRYRMSDTSVTDLNIGLNNTMIWSISSSRTKKGYFATGRQDTGSDWYDGENWHITGLKGDGYSPVLWHADQIYEDKFLVNMGGVLMKFNIVTDNKDPSFSSQCFTPQNYSTSIFQNPNPYYPHQIFYNKSYGSGANVSMGISQSSNYASSFDLLDTVKAPWAAASRDIYIPYSDFNHIYLWNYVFDNSFEDAKLFMLNRTYYSNPNGGQCDEITATNSAATGRRESFKEIKTLPADDYDFDNYKIGCSNFWSHTNDSAIIANFFPISAVAVSSENKNKVWVAYEFDPLKVEDVGTKRYYVRKTENLHSVINPQWVNDDNGLAALEMPIDNLVYLDGSNDMLFCSTINGRVFYKDKSMSAWQELDPSLPHSKIMKMEINYCTSKLYLATFGAGVWSYDLTKLPVQSAMEITGQRAWASVKKDIGSDIIIKKGALLEITANSEINLCKGCKIIIEEGDLTTKGGRLYIQNSTLSNSCGDFWDGIEVRGQNLLPQPEKSTLKSITLTPLDPNAPYIHPIHAVKFPPLPGQKI